MSLTFKLNKLRQGSFLHSDVYLFMVASYYTISSKQCNVLLVVHLNAVLVSFFRFEIYIYRKLTTQAPVPNLLVCHIDKVGQL